MRPFAVLYLKEFKDNLNTVALLWVATFAIGLYAISQQVEAGIWVSILAASPYMGVLILPFLLAQSFASEIKAQTNYQLLALPIARWQVGLSKVAVVVTAGSGIWLFTTGAIHWLAIGFDESDMTFLQGSKLQGIDIWVLSGLGYHAFALLLLGITCVMEGAKQSIKKRRKLLSLGVFIACFWVYFKFTGELSIDLGDLGVYSLESEFLHSDEPMQAPIAGLLYTAVMGIGFIAIGLGLYDRFAEVD